MPKISRDSFLVGDIRHTLLTEAQLHDLVGSDQIWVLMDGRDVTGSSYTEVTGRTNIPDISGRFLRAAGGNAAALGQTQNFQTAMNSDNFNTSGVTNNVGAHSHNTSNAGSTNINIAVNNVGNHSHSISLRQAQTYSYRQPDPVMSCDADPLYPYFFCKNF